MKKTFLKKHFLIIGLLYVLSVIIFNKRVNINDNKNNDIIKKLSILHYSIQMNSNNIGECLLSKASILSDELDSSNMIAAEKAFVQAEEIFTKESNLHSLTILKINRAVNYMQLKDTLYFLNTMDSLLIEDVFNSPILHYYKNITLGDYYYNIRNLSKAKRHYLLGLDVWKDENCNEYKDILHAYLAEVYLAQENADSVALLIPKLEAYKSCPDVDANQVMYYLQDIYYQYQRLLLDQGNDINQREILTLLYDRRKYASEMFADEDEFHLGDLYDQNAHRIFLAYDELYDGSIPPEEQDRFLDLLYDNTWRKVKREKFEKLSSKQKKREQEINKLLRYVNDFKNDFGYDDPAYKRLYELIVEEAHLEPKKLIDTRPYISLDTSNYQYIVFQSYGTKLWNVHIDGKSIELHQLWADDIKQLGENLNQKLLKRELHEEVSHQLSQALFQNIKYKKPLYLITDNYTSTLSLGVLLDSSFIVDHTFNLNNPIDIDANNHVVFSYSDEESLKETDIELVELASGVKESKKVNEVLGGGKLLMDEQFTEEALLENDDVDIMHISTHAITNSKVRQDCYLAINDEQGKMEKFYGYDVIKMEHSPMFVNLSACNTGIGYQLAGNGTYSLSREFLRNGTQSVLKTLWPVDDKATFIFQTQLYKCWKQGNSLGEALDLARKNLKSDDTYCHPYYWAGFILEGNPNLYLK